MRIEGTYTFPAAIDRVFAALLDPDLLQEIIPGCERLIQLGPTTPESGTTFEARVRGQGNQGGYSTLTLKTTILRRPDHMRLEVRGHTPSGPISGQATIDLVEQGEQHTLGAYVLTLTTPDTAPNVSSISNASSAAGQNIIAAFCERLADWLYQQTVYAEAETYAGEVHTGAMVLPPDQLGPVQYQTSRGAIVTLPNRWLERRRAPGALWLQRALLMGMGMLLGISVLSAAIGLMRWLGDHAD